MTRPSYGTCDLCGDTGPLADAWADGSVPCVACAAVVAVSVPATIGDRMAVLWLVVAEGLTSAEVAALT